MKKMVCMESELPESSFAWNRARPLCLEKGSRRVRNLRVGSKIDEAYVVDDIGSKKEEQIRYAQGKR